MRTVVIGPQPPEIEALIAERRRLGLDKHDEVWEGDYHMNYGPSGPHGWVSSQLQVILTGLARPLGWYLTAETNIGEAWDFRVPDLIVHRDMPLLKWFPTAAVVVEVESPGDESRDKFGFYADHGVDEVLIVSPQARTVEWFVLSDQDASGGLGGRRYDTATVSRLLGPKTEVGLLGAQIEWPPLGCAES